MERSVAQALLETWWNEDPEMRYSEIKCGEDYRCHVTLWQIFWDEPHERPLGYGEAGDLESATQIAIADAKAKQKGNSYLTPEQERLLREIREAAGAKTNAQPRFLVTAKIRARQLRISVDEVLQNDIRFLNESEPECFTTNGWQPVDTAPKDGTLILAYRKDAGLFLAQYWPEDKAWFIDNGEDVTADMFTHWMPLPQPPAQD